MQFPFALVLLLSLTTSVQAQVIFHEDFESGLDAWTVAGDIWHAETDSDPCGLQVAPFPLGQTGAYFGLPTCDYIGITQNNTIKMNQPVHLPEDAGSVTLKYWGFEEAECLQCFWDLRLVFVYSAEHPNGFDVGVGTQMGVWYENSIDLTPYRGQDIQLLFMFAPADEEMNDFFGWIIDDIKIEISEGPESYCASSPNSAGSGALMGWVGSSSVASNDFEVTASGAPPGEWGLFYYGPAAIAAPFGNGTRCVGAGAIGTFRLNPPALVDGAGTLTRALDLGSPPAGTGPGQIVGGSEWFFQCWYRDQVGVGHNLSNGLRVPFSP